MRSKQARKRQAWLSTLSILCVLGFGLWLISTLKGCSSDLCINGVCPEKSVESTSQDASTQPEEAQDGLAPRKPAAQLIDNAQWKLVPESKDPFIKYKKSASKCEEAQGRKVEDGVLEIDTDFCNYITLEQPTLTEIRSGELVEFVMWHLELYAQTPGTGYVALMINEEMVWEKSIGIPGKAQYYEPTWSPKTPIPKGAQVVLHLHNHGANTWKFHSLTTGEPF